MEICRLIFRWFAPPCKRVGFAPTQGWTYCRVRLPTAGYHVSILGVTLHRVGTPDLQLLRQNFWPQIFRQNPWLFTSSWLCWQEPVATMIKSMTSNNPLQVKRKGGNFVSSCWKWNLTANVPIKRDQSQNLFQAVFWWAKGPLQYWGLNPVPEMTVRWWTLANKIKIFEEVSSSRPWENGPFFICYPDFMALTISEARLKICSSQMCLLKAVISKYYLTQISQKNFPSTSDYLITNTPFHTQIKRWSSDLSPRHSVQFILIRKWFIYPYYIHSLQSFGVW